jgi:microcystin-dependent protein
MSPFLHVAATAHSNLEPLIALLVCMAFAAVYVSRTQRS